MPNLVEVKYAQTGASTKTNIYGMREMQERAFAARDAQYLLIKAPPASGKSRALMFIALDKIVNQGLKKVIVAVPERSIGASFKATALSQFGFLLIGIPMSISIFALPVLTTAKVRSEYSRVSLLILMQKF